MGKHVCPECKTDFVQPFVCISCGAQYLYDSTLLSAQVALDRAHKRIDKLMQVNALLNKENQTLLQMRKDIESRDLK